MLPHLFWKFEFFARSSLHLYSTINLMVFSVLHYPQTFLIVFSAVYVCVFFFSFPPSSNSWFIGPEKDKIMLVYRVWPCRQFNKMLGTLVVSVLWQTLKNLLFLFVLWRTTKTHKNCMYLCNLNKEERRRGNSDQQSILILACDRLSARLVASNANRAYWLPCATNRAPFHTLCLTFFPLCFLLIFLHRDLISVGPSFELLCLLLVCLHCPSPCIHKTVVGEV